MKKETNLINGLFSSPQSGTTKRTFKISNECWDEFLILTVLRGSTQAEMINSFIEQAVAENRLEIEEYKKLTKS